MAEARSQTVVVDERRLHFLEWGRVDAPVVLVLHGFTGHAWQTDHPAQVLADRCRVLALDQRGHGDSDRADVYGSVPMAADVIGFLDAIGVEQVALVGHSLGGIVGTCVTALHPERVTRLVLGDIGPEFAPEGVARIQRNVAERDVFTSVVDAVTAQAELNPTANPVALRHRVEHNLVAQSDGRLTWKYDAALRDGSAEYENYSTDEQWAFFTGIAVPVLVIRGERSDILSPEIAARMLAVNPNASLVTLPGAGHSIATDAPDLVAAALVEFLGA